MSEQVSETSLGMQILLQGEQSIYNRILADIATGKLISGDRLVTNAPSDMLPKPVLIPFVRR
ncbi:hypothetical protein P4S73_10235 [Paraglaciecola sp. Hal342]